MALQKQFEDEYGVTHTEAYWRAENFSIAGKVHCFFQANAYSSAAAAAGGKSPVGNKLFNFVYDFDSDQNLIEQGYAVLTADAFFSDATSV